MLSGTTSEDLADLPPQVDVLVLSPHLDDAALSCGGSMHRLAVQEGKTVCVVNVFTGDAPPDEALSAGGRELHALWRRAGRFEGAVMAHRRAEEHAACERLGVEVRCLGFLDALYRQDEKGSPLYEPVAQVMGRRHPDDDALLDTLQAKFRQLPRAATWWLPMAIGHHVDHVLVREAAERLPGLQRLYYEDYPYARSRWQRLKARWGRGLRRGFIRRRKTQSLGREDVQAKVEAIACYRSQLSAVFADRSDMERQVRRFSKDGERLWS